MGYSINWTQARSFTDDEWDQIKTHVEYMHYRYGGGVFQKSIVSYCDDENEFINIDAGGIDINSVGDGSFETFQIHKHLVKNPHGYTPEDQEGEAVGRILFLEKGEEEYHDYQFDPIRGTRWDSVKTSRGVYGLACFELLRFVEYISPGALIDVGHDGLDGIYGEDFQNHYILKHIGGVL